jgi:hypothetical protein
MSELFLTVFQIPLCEFSRDSSFSLFFPPLNYSELINPLIHLQRSLQSVLLRRRSVPYFAPHTGNFVLVFR